MARKGLVSMSFQDILQRELSHAVDAPVYCRYCGKDLRHGSINSPRGSAQELENSAHERCHVNYRNSLLQEQYPNRR